MTLGGRKLMYHVDPLDAYAKGEIFLGHTSSGYLVVPGFGPGFREQGFGFIMHTPDRAYQVNTGNSVLSETRSMGITLAYDITSL